MGNNKKIVINYIYNLLYQILIIIVPLITTPYVSRVLGVEQIGIYSYTISITTYFILFGSLGSALYGQREIAYNQSNKNKISKTFIEIFLARIISMSISLIVFFVVLVKNNIYSIYYKILILEIIAQMIDISWLFQGLEEFKKVVFRNIIVKIVSVCSIFIFVKNNNDLNIYIFIYVLSTFLGNASLWFYVSKYIEKIEIKSINIFKHFKPMALLFVPQIAIQIYTVLDKTMIGMICENKSEVGLYEQAQKIIKLLVTIATALGTVMIPRIANAYSNKDFEGIKLYIKKSFQFIMFLGFPLMFGIISISNKFVPVFYGVGYDGVKYLINYMSPIVVIIGISNVIGNQYLLPIKRQKEFTVAVTVGAIINFILNMIFIKKWGAIGATISTIIAELCVSTVQLFYVRKEIDILNLIKLTKNYCIASIIMFGVSITVNSIIQDYIISIIIQIISSVCVYIISLICLKDDLIQEGMRFIRGKMKRETTY